MLMNLLSGEARWSRSRAFFS